MTNMNSLRRVTGDELHMVQGGFLGGIVKKIGQAVSSYAQKVAQGIVNTAVAHVRRRLFPWL